MANSIINKFFLVLLFTIFFVKYSIVIENQGVSANYLYFFFPVLTWFIKENFFIPPIEILLILFLYTLIYFTSFFFHYSDLNIQISSLISFLIFINIFIFSTIKLNKDLINIFKISIVFVSVLYSLNSIIILYLNFSPELNIKNITGSQRYGFILIFAFWILCLSKNRGGGASFNIIKFILLAILIIGLILTFSRSSIVSMIFTFLIFMIFFMKKKTYSFKIQNIFFLFLLLCLLLCLLIIVITLNLEFLRFTYNFYVFTFSIFENSSIKDPSILERLYIYDFIYDYIFNTNTNQMLFGSGFLGVWISKIDLVNSAHNQYLDVLFRTGVSGLLLYLWLLFRILIFLKKYDLSLFIGFVGVLVFGLFNETFKESQGSFLLSFLLGMYSSRGKKYFK